MPMTRREFNAVKEAAADGHRLAQSILDYNSMYIRGQVDVEVLLDTALKEWRRKREI